MKIKHVFDYLIVLMMSLFAASCFSKGSTHLMGLIPLCAVYGVTEVVLISARHRHDEEFGADPREPVRQRFCMLLYLHGITAADWRIAGVILVYAIFVRLAHDRGVMFVVHGLGMIALSVATVFAEPRGIAAWAPVLTLIGILVFLIWTDDP